MKWWSELPYTQKQAWAGRLFILPWLLGFCFIFFRSLIMSFLYSLSKITVGDHGFILEFIGLANYQYAFNSDPNFTKTLVESLSSMLYQVPLILIL